MASLEDPSCPVDQITFLLLAALIERNGSVVGHVVLPVIEGDDPQTQKHSDTRRQTVVSRSLRHPQYNKRS